MSYVDVRFVAYNMNPNNNNTNTNNNTNNNNNNNNSNNNTLTHSHTLDVSRNPPTSIFSPSPPCAHVSISLRGVDSDLILRLWAQRIAPELTRDEEGNELPVPK